MSQLLSEIHNNKPTREQAANFNELIAQAMNQFAKNPIGFLSTQNG